MNGLILLLASVLIFRFVALNRAEEGTTDYRLDVVGYLVAIALFLWTTIRALLGMW